MIVLDTNVASELMKPFLDPAVRDWIGACRGDELYTTSITLAEIRYAFDAVAAVHYPMIVARRDRAGLSIDGFDAQIASICHTHGAALATRNLKDFQDAGIDVIDPWQAA